MLITVTRKDLEFKARMLAAAGATLVRRHNDLLAAMAIVFEKQIVENSPEIERVIYALDRGNVEPFLAWLDGGSR